MNKNELNETQIIQRKLDEIYIIDQQKSTKT
jgi:hypothetical protein